VCPRTALEDDSRSAFAEWVEVDAASADVDELPRRADPTTVSQGCDRVQDSRGTEQAGDAEEDAHSGQFVSQRWAM
jgi:hypothetical protein